MNPPPELLEFACGGIGEAIEVGIGGELPPINLLSVIRARKKQNVRKP